MTEADPTRIRFVSLEPSHAGSLGELFAVLVARGEEAHFHPHPLTLEEAHARATRRGRDGYFVALEGDRVVGYAMLRGWDDGYTVPSLGIALHPDVRGSGTARRLMLHLHDAARSRGARRVRLKVHPGNVAAVRLYRELGYAFSGTEQGQMVGHVAL